MRGAGKISRRDLFDSHINDVENDTHPSSKGQKVKRRFFLLSVVNFAISMDGGLYECKSNEHY